MEQDIQHNDNTEKLRKMVAALRPGQSIWTLDDTGFEIREYIFMASCPRYPGSPDSALIVSGLPFDVRTYEALIDYHLHECAYGDETYVRVLPPNEIFINQDEAYAATNKEFDEDN